MDRAEKVDTDSMEMWVALVRIAEMAARGPYPDDPEEERLLWCIWTEARAAIDPEFRERLYKGEIA
jgi:hypothetical protein